MVCQVVPLGSSPASGAPSVRGQWATPAGAPPEPVLHRQRGGQGVASGADLETELRFLAFARIDAAQQLVCLKRAITAGVDKIRD